MDTDHPAVNDLPDVGLWAHANKCACISLNRIAEACIRAGLRPILYWSSREGRGRGKPEDYPVKGLQFKQVAIPRKFPGVQHGGPLSRLLMQSSIRRALRESRPRCLLTHLDNVAEGRVLHYLGRRMGIQGVVVQEGMTNVPKTMTDHTTREELLQWRPAESVPLRRRIVECLPHPLLTYYPTYMYAEVACVWGEAMRRYLRRMGRRDESIFITGSPSFDDVRGRGPVRPAIPPTILYAQQAMATSQATRLPFYAKLIQICATDLRCRLLFKLHPDSLGDAPKVRELVRGVPDAEKWVEIVDRGDSVDLLSRASLLLTGSSTTAYYAAIQGVPLVLIDYFSPKVRFDVGPSGGAAVVRRPEELAETLRSCVFDEDRRLALHEGAGRLITDHLHALDGQAASRIAAVLRGLLGAPTQPVLAAKAD